MQLSVPFNLGYVCKTINLIFDLIMAEYGELVKGEKTEIVSRKCNNPQIACSVHD